MRSNIACRLRRVHSILLLLLLLNAMEVTVAQQCSEGRVMFSMCLVPLLLLLQHLALLQQRCKVRSLHWRRHVQRAEGHGGQGGQHGSP